MRGVFVLPMVCLVVPALAVDGSVTLGGLFTSGNSDVEQLDSGLELSGSPSAKLETGFAAAVSYGSQESETYLEKYSSEGTLKYSFTENSYAASRVFWLRDEFSGIDGEYGASAGYGRMLFNGEIFTASLEAGAGYLSRENTVGEELETSTWYGAAGMEWLPSSGWTITENARFNGDFQDSENYSVESSLEASSAIAGDLSLVLGYDLTYYNLPPVEGSEKTDTALRIQLRYDL